jgi:ankyrin repeat protein
LIFSSFAQNMTNHLKKSWKHIAAIGYLAFIASAWAGSYDDFFKAVQLDNPRGVEALLQRGFDPNTVNPEGVPALIKALQEQSFKVASVLASQEQTRIDVRNARDESPLMLAALRGQETLVVHLVSRGAAVNKSGWTPLHYAATGGHLRVAAFLIGAHADVNAESPNGTTPLMMAAMYASSDMVKLLLESGAEAYLRNDQGLDAEDFAQKAGREDSARLIQQVLSR